MLKIPKNSAKKLNFRLIFGSFSITPSYALLVTPQFLLGIKGLMEMYNCGKFHLYSICGCQAIKSEMFLWRWRIHEMAHFRGFWGPSFPKYGPIFKQKNNFTDDLNLKKQNESIPKRLLFLINALIDGFNRDVINVSQESLTAAQIIVSNRTHNEPRQKVITH